MNRDGQDGLAVAPHRHAVITGGSSGIGRALAILLAAGGYQVSLIARDPERLREAQRVIGEQARVFVADVADEDATNAAVAGAIAAAGAPSLLVACAGMVEARYFLETPAAVFRRMMDVNYLGAVHTIRAGLPAMNARGEGHLVLVSSGLGLMAMPGYAAYCGSKYALRGLAEALRCELKPAGIGVSIVYPPDTDTPQLHEELKARPPEARAIAGSAKVLSAHEVAASIVEGVRRGSFTIAPGLEMTLLARLNSLLEPALHWYIDRTAAPFYRR